MTIMSYAVWMMIVRSGDGSIIVSRPFANVDNAKMWTESFADRDVRWNKIDEDTYRARAGDQTYELEREYLR